MEQVGTALMKMVNKAISMLPIRERYGQTTVEDFRTDVLEKLFTYSLPLFDPSRAQLSTFVFNHVKNHWLNYQNSLIKELQRERSLDDPVSDESADTFIDTLEDPRSVDFVSQVEANEMYQTLHNALKDPRYQEVLRLWVDDTTLNDELESLGMPPATRERSAKQKAEDIAQIIAQKFPERPLGSVRVNRIIHDIVKEEVRKQFPEAIGWAETAIPATGENELIDPLIIGEESEVPFSARDEDDSRVALNLRRRAVKSAAQKYSENLWYATFMTWLKVELNGKLR